MESVTIISKSHTAVGSDVANIYILVDIDYKFAFRVNFDEYFLFIHRFNHFANVGSLFLLKYNFFKNIYSTQKKMLIAYQ